MMKQARYWGGCCRSVKTTNEKRQYDNAVDQGVTPRFRRNKFNLPNSWDDYRFACFEERNWKERTKRKHQWKDKKESKCYNCKFWFPYTEYKIGNCNIDDKDLEKKYGTLKIWWTYFDEGERKSYETYDIPYKDTFANESCVCWSQKRKKYR